MNQKLLVYNSVIGRIYCRIIDGYLTGLSIGKNDFPDIQEFISLPSLKNELEDYFHGKLHCFTQKIMFIEGTDFQKSVWNKVQSIKYGETVSYKAIAGSLNMNGGYQAVGVALSKNPIPIVVPCHRVIGIDGALVGFSSGVAIKRWLINHEKRFRDYCKP
jgi:O-6-methylguanine DNA methyltransferase